MNNPSQEDLLGYVLGALDAQEHRNVQQLIDDNPEIEEQLLQIKNSLLPLDCLSTSGPPPGLARRTCESVAGWQVEPDTSKALSIPDHVGSLESGIQLAIDDSAPVKPKRLLRSSVSDRFLHPKSWSIQDVLAGMAMIAIVAGILLPTISYTRHRSRMIACRNNLTEVGVALFKYSSVHDGQFVAVPRDGNLAAIGCFGPILKDCGLLEDDSLLACAGVAAELPPVQIPSCDEVINASCTERIRSLRRRMAGHYGYTMGYWDGRKYCPPRNLGRSDFVLVSDQPSPRNPGRVSDNHENGSQNCLMGDLSVLTVKGPAIGNDALFFNNYCIVAPGSDERDNVIGPSHLSIVPANLTMEVITSSH